MALPAACALVRHSASGPNGLQAAETDFGAHAPLELSLPKIISARSDDAARTEWAPHHAHQREPAFPIRDDQPAMMYGSVFLGQPGVLFIDRNKSVSGW